MNIVNVKLAQTLLLMPSQTGKYSSATAGRSHDQPAQTQHKLINTLICGFIQWLLWNQFFLETIVFHY